MCLLGHGDLFRDQVTTEILSWDSKSPLGRFMFIHVVPMLFGALDSLCAHAERLQVKQKSGLEITASDVRLLNAVLFKECLCSISFAGRGA